MNTLRLGWLATYGALLGQVLPRLDSGWLIALVAVASVPLIVLVFIVPPEW